MSEAREVVEAELAEVIEGCGAYVTDAWRAAEELYASGWRKTGGDDVIELVAYGIHATHGRGWLFDAEDHAVQDEYREMARAALTAAIGDDDE